MYWGSAKLDWVLPDGRARWVIQLTDAATGRVFARVAKSNSSVRNLSVLRTYILTYGLWAAVTTNITSLFVFKAARLEASPGRLKTPTRIEQTLKELGIELRSVPNGVHREPRGVLWPSSLTRLSAALREIQASTVEEANRYLIKQCLGFRRK